MSYRFKFYDFSEKEIEQICQLIKKWAEGASWKPIDARKFTRNVKNYAVEYHLLEEHGNRYYTTYFSAYKNKGNVVFDHRYGMPSEALWRLICPMLDEDGTGGHSIVNNELWYKHLAIAPDNSKYITDQEKQDKIDILLRLDMDGYIYFQMAGSVWSISPKEQVVRA